MTIRRSIRAISGTLLSHKSTKQPFQIEKQQEITTARAIVPPQGLECGYGASGRQEDIADVRVGGDDATRLVVKESATVRPYQISIGWRPVEAWLLRKTAYCCTSRSDLGSLA